MATRYWKAKWNMGFVGTDSEEDMDLLDYCESLEDVANLSDEEAQNIVTEIAYEMAYEEASSMIEVYAEKAETEEE